MKDKLKKIIKKIPVHTWILIGIVVFGIFLRTYNFHQWLRFNADQGRDVQLVSDVIKGNEKIPLLGPKAGGTDFKLGPIFYYFQIVSARMFGIYPDKVAYPDLVFSVLCIPLVFFFFCKIFDRKVSLVLTAIFSVSSYAVFYSRFAWNPNSTPFWTILFLYALFEIFSKKENKKIFWSVIAAIAVGVGVQLHTTLLLFFPLLLVIIFGYAIFLKRKKSFWKYFFIILAISLFLNTPQFINEYQTGGGNAKEFFRGMEKKKEAETFFEKVAHSSSCWVQSSAYIVSGYEIDDKCSFKPEKNKLDVIIFTLSSIFLIGGVALGIKRIRNEKEEDERFFLMIILVFTVIVYLIFIPLAFELSVRFFLVLIFWPFLILGFWLEFFREKLIRYFKFILLAIFILFVFSNLFFIYKIFAENRRLQTSGDDKQIEYIMLGEVENIANFIIENSDNTKKIYLDGNGQFLFKSFKSIRFLTRRSGIELIELNKENPQRYFYLASLNKKDKILNSQSENILDYKTFGRFTIILMRK